MDHLNHKHIMLNGIDLQTPLRSAHLVIDWLLELVEKVGMKVLFGPNAVRCDTMGNEGVTGLVCIETSHASIHVWDSCDRMFFKADLYSCKDFDIQQVIEHCRVFGPVRVDYVVIDRNEATGAASNEISIRVIDQGIHRFK